MCSAFLLSTGRSDSPPQFQRPIRRSERKLSGILATYPLHQVIVPRTTECLSAASNDSQSIVRGVFRGGARKHTLHRMHLARGVWFGVRYTWGVCNTPLLYRQKKLSLMTDSGGKLSAISATYLLHRTKALRIMECLSAAPDESPRRFRRPIYYIG